MHSHNGLPLKCIYPVRARIIDAGEGDGSEKHFPNIWLFDTGHCRLRRAWIPSGEGAIWWHIRT